MKFTGFEIRNFRSIGNEPIVLNPLRKCNILVGQNNSGKSNVIRALQKTSDWIMGSNSQLEEIDKHNRSSMNEFKVRVYFQVEENVDEFDAVRKNGIEYVWFDLAWHKGSILVTDISLASISNFSVANQVLLKLFARQWESQVHQEDISREFKKYGYSLYDRLKTRIPNVKVIPEFRQVRRNEKIEGFELDGTNLIELLNNYQHPVIGKDQDQDKFDQIQDFTRKLLHLPKAQLEVTSQSMDLVIKNNGFRLPLRSFGTGVHELIILVTATLSLENTICCIEEPEIHLHPRLQQELIDFLLHHTSNCYIISTHSPAFINTFDYEEDVQVIHLMNNDNVTTGTVISSDAQVLSTLRDLGYRGSDLLQPNCIIWVEGPSDRNLIARWLKLLAPDLIEGKDFVFFFYIGLPKLNIDPNGFESEMTNVLSLNRNAIYVTDSDRKSENEDCNQIKTKLATQCEIGGGLGWITDGKEIENYIPSTVLKKFLNEIRKVDIEIQVGPFENLGETLDSLAEREGFAKINYSNCKKDYSRKLAELFTVEEIPAPLKNWLEKMIKQIRLWKA